VGTPAARWSCPNLDQVDVQDEGSVSHQELDRLEAELARVSESLHLLDDPEADADAVTGWLPPDA